MRWKKESFGLGHGKRRSGSSSKDKNSPASGSSKRRSSKQESTNSPQQAADVPHLATIRVGVVTSAPICTPTPRAKRQLISDLLEVGEDGTDSEEVVAASPALRSIISNKSSSGKNFDKEAGRGDSFSTYTSEEKAVFAGHLNQHLLGDPFLKHLLPLDPQGSDFFRKFKDGALLCRLVCLAIPGSIADSKINIPTGDEILSLYKSTENLNAALAAAETAGLQVVNIGARDIIDGRPASILGLSWQLIRMHLLAQINLKGCPDLIHLMEDGEEESDFYKLPVEDMLLRWFNHHLRWAGSVRRVSNFGEDLADGRCYMTLVQELNDKFKKEQMDESDKDESIPQHRRACLVISGATRLGLAPLIRAGHITGRAHMYNVAFVAQLLNRRPRIHREKLHLQASITMQSWYRMVRVVNSTGPIFEQRRLSAVKVSRVCRRWLQLRKRTKAATMLQAWSRGVWGRQKTDNLRLAMAEAARAEAAARAKAAREAAAARVAEAARAEEAKAEAAARVQEAAAAEEARVKKAEAEARAAAKEEETRRAAEALAEREARTVAATEVQAWARGVSTRRRYVQELKAARQRARMAGLLRSQASFSSHASESDSSSESSDDDDDEESAPAATGDHDTHAMWHGTNKLKHNRDLSSVSPRTSIASSIRVSEEHPDAVYAALMEHQGVAPFAEGRGWFDKVFAGMTFGEQGRGGKNVKKQEAAAAMAIQRWALRCMKSRAEVQKAMEAVARRRWAARRLHKAYARTWRLEIKARRVRRQKWAEADARQKASSSWKLGWFISIWGDLVGVTSRSSRLLDEEDKLDARDSRRKRALKKKGLLGDCCDAAGQHVIASEVQAWNTSYVKAVVLGYADQGQAQEKRAEVLAKVGSDDRAWTSPENALSAGRFVAMLSVLLTVLYESALCNAAALGV